MSTANNGFFPRVSRRYANFKVSVLITFLRNVIALMTGNPAFNKPVPDLATMSTAVGDLETTTQAALNGGKIQIAARRASEASALSLARQLGNFVETAANGNMEVLLSSGYEAVRAPSRPAMPDAPTSPRFTYTKTTGELLFTFKGRANVKNYSVQHAESALGPWIDHSLSTSSRVLIGGLVPGKMYWGRARANAAAGSSDWSSPTSLMAI